MVFVFAMTDGVVDSVGYKMSNGCVSVVGEPSPITLVVDGLAIDILSFVEMIALNNVDGLPYPGDTVPVKMGIHSHDAVEDILVSLVGAKVAIWGVECAEADAIANEVGESAVSAKVFEGGSLPANEHGINDVAALANVIKVTAVIDGSEVLVSNDGDPLPMTLVDIEGVFSFDEIIAINWGGNALPGFTIPVKVTSGDETSKMPDHITLESGLKFGAINDLVKSPLAIAIDDGKGNSIVETLGFALPVNIHVAVLSSHSALWDASAKKESVG